MSDLLGGDFSNIGSGDLDGELDLDRAASVFPDINVDDPVGVPIPSSHPPPALPSFSSFDSFTSPTASQAIPPPAALSPGLNDFDGVNHGESPYDVKVTGDDEIGAFESQFPDLNGGPTFQSAIPPAQQPLFAAPATPFAPRPQPSAFSSTPLLQQPIADEQEPEVIKQWREQQAADIKARDDASHAKRQETIAAAERNIDLFYEEYAKKKERNIKENKEQEAEYLSHLTSSLAQGTTWSRICKLVELETNQSKTLAATYPGTTDLARMKEVLLRLRREGDTAPGAAGY